MSRSPDDDIPAAYEHEYRHAERSKTLKATAQDPFTEISIIDWNLQPLQGVHGLGALEANVAPGLYKVRFKTATTVHDELVEVPAHASEPIVVSAPILHFPSPVPLYIESDPSEASRLAIDRAGLAEREGQQVQEGEGLGAQVFLYVQAWTPPELPKVSEGEDRSIRIQSVAPAASRARPGRGMALYSPVTGKVVIDLGDSQFHHGDVRVSCANVEVAPGAYLLRARTSGIGTYEIPIHACNGWQTAVFVQSRPLLVGTKSALFADIPQASIFLFRNGERWTLNDPSVRLTEQAKWLIRQTRPIISDDVVQNMLEMKRFNPMLGIFAAHFLQMRADTNWDLLGSVLRHLGSLLDSHPDLVALDSTMPRDRKLFATPEFAFPPMLRASWRLVVKSVELGGAVIPEGSFSDSIFEELPRGSLWLSWRRTRISMPLSRAITGMRKRQLVEDASAQEPKSGLRAGGAKPRIGPRAAKVPDTARQSSSSIDPKMLPELGKSDDAPRKSDELRKRYQIAWQDAMAAGVEIPEDLRPFLTDAGVASEAVNILEDTSTVKAKTPLEHFVLSWQRDFPEVTSDSVQELSNWSELPPNVIQRTLDRLKD